eukprot:jgi/Psemu1/323598/estExt_fgenesh1_pg.C_820004
MRQQVKERHSNKHGVWVSEVPVLRGPGPHADINKHDNDKNGTVMPMNEDIQLEFEIGLDDEDDDDDDDAGTTTRLKSIKLTGSSKKDFRLVTRAPFEIKPPNESNGDDGGNGGNGGGNGDGDGPRGKRKPRYEKRVSQENVVHPPKQTREGGGGSGSGGGGGNGGYKGLGHFKVPPDNLLWASELQAYNDIQLFDMENVAFERRGRFFQLHVSGLAEGRPSVLKGDIVLCYWKSKEYRGRVVAIEQLDALIEFHESFHLQFHVGVDRVEKVRFTFTRTPFRTNTNTNTNTGGGGGPALNKEQKDAVCEIVKGTLRPLPYIVFGPPGTGKTTTIVEAVYQLAKLHTSSRGNKQEQQQQHQEQQQQPMLKILLVAPSNDATDILVEKLSRFFPPSEMMFYRNQLVPCGDKFTTHSMLKWEHLPKKGFPVLFHAVDGENTREGNSPSWFNAEEAMVVGRYVKDLVNNSKPKISPDDIGIITPYARQVQKIRTTLKLSDVGDVKVGSVETFQGQERRIIIISTVRSQNDLLVHDKKYNLGFVANEKRFNVAVTRAKALLIVVGNPKVLATDEKNWLPLLRFCRDNGSWLGEEWDDGASSEEEEDNDDDDVESNGCEENDDEDEWHVVAQEAQGFINREE